jgi:hypothetical protein
MTDPIFIQIKKDCFRNVAFLLGMDIHRDEKALGRIASVTLTFAAGGEFSKFGDISHGELDVEKIKLEGEYAEKVVGKMRAASMLQM